MTTRPTSSLQNNVTFDETYDVIVVGYGFAGARSAIAAADKGAKVLLAEKEEVPGGISICSGGSMRGTRKPDEVFAYLKATNGGRTPDDVLRALADGMGEMEQEVATLAAVSNATVETKEMRGNYPFPGVTAFTDSKVIHLPGCEDLASAYPHVMARPSASGWRMMKVLEDNVAKRSKNVDVRFEFPAHRLITNAQREVVGVTFEGSGGRKINVKARRGVILACGGFEANEEMKRQFWEKSPVLTATSIANTGDGIRMAQELGADLWHMWHYHGSYGFKHPDAQYPVAIRVKRLPDWFPGDEKSTHVKMCWIVVDQDGRRYMNECTPYTQDTSHRPMEFFDSVRQKFPRLPSYLIYDENGRKMYQIGAPTYNKKGLAFSWSEDNQKEVELGIVKKANSIEELARLTNVDAPTMESTLNRWNELCKRGEDSDFGRPAGTMTPIDTAPYYVGEVWPVVSNTQGGPVHNPRQQIMNVFNEPIPRLYAAGEMGSAFGYLYLSGGNLAECLVTGKIAGNHAAGLPDCD